MKIALGTTSKQKLEYLQTVLDDIGIKTKIFPIEVSSKISSQPLTQEETEKGSKNRALEALNKTPEADFSMGIEIGYQNNKQNKFEMFCCTSIADKSNFLETCYSSKFLLPQFHQKILKENKDLGEYVREFKKSIDKPVTNYTRELVRGRKPLITEAVRNILLRYLEKEEY